VQLTTPFPNTGAHLKTSTCKRWLDRMSESNSILGAILAVIHPELYDLGRQTLECLRKVPKLQRQNVLSQWTSPFNGVSVISQRKTPRHRDGNSMHHWYDMLVTLGKYKKCNFELPGLGLTLKYGPRTVVGFSGMVLEHEVKKFTGERVCYAYFMRDSVHEWAKVRPGSWMNTKYYSSE
jgi:hypothetical protein